MFPDSIVGYLDPRNFLRCSQQVAKAVGLGHQWLHILRHTSSTTLLAGGQDVAVVQKQLGDSSPQVTLETYSHALPSRQAEAAATLDRLVGTGSKIIATGAAPCRKYGRDALPAPSTV